MTIEDFKTYVKTRKPLDTEEIHRFMDDMSNEARRITFRLNTAYHTPDEVRGLLSKLFGYEVPQSLRVFPPLYADFGKNITVGENVFINACCHFQDHGGVTIGENTVVGAGSVVTRDLPANCIAVGSPARVLRYLDEKDKIDVWNTYINDELPLSVREKEKLAK